MVSWRICEEGYQFVEGANGWGSDVALVVVSCHMRLEGGGGGCLLGIPDEGGGVHEGYNKEPKKIQACQERAARPTFQVV